MKPNPVIGVFDSGFGGLTVLRALLRHISQARYAFLGDTARLPYGSKSRRTIARYAAESAQFLVREQGAEYLVIACNTASALALDAIQDAVPVPVLGVIEPGAASARAASRSGAAEATAEAAARVFGQHCEDCAAPNDQIRCFATDSVDKFERLGSRFLERPVGKVNLVDLGG